MDSSSGTSPGKTAFSTGQPLEARQPERYDKESDQMKNGIMMQYFEWNLPNDGQFWNKLKEDAPPPGGNGCYGRLDSSSLQREGTK
ncbi:hypothetical protein J5W81_02880 [Akkermansia muciniphila]|nr:hypothetical protein [Akkermansia muciniphila]QWP24873.1 hypothetical protein J5W81_02880 [Akkermansia muciniphila]